MTTPLNLKPEALAHVNTQAIWVTLFLADTLVAEGSSDEHNNLERVVFMLSAELDKRYDGPATERTADWVTGNHMDGDDAVRWALHNFEHLERVARGEVTRT